MRTKKYVMTVVTNDDTEYVSTPMIQNDAFSLPTHILGIEGFWVGREIGRKRYHFPNESLKYIPSSTIHEIFFEEYDADSDAERADPSGD